MRNFIKFKTNIDRKHAPLPPVTVVVMVDVGRYLACLRPQHFTLRDVLRLGSLAGLLCSWRM